MTAQQNSVLQAIYDYFHNYGSWPTFITIDRPLRREYGMDTAAVIQSLPASMIVPPRPGNLRPIARDELRLHLPGIAQCMGSSRETRPLIEVLRWLAEKEVAYEPQPGSDAESPRITSAEVAEFLGPLGVDQLALKRLFEMLRLDDWGIGGFGSNEDSWYVTLEPDIWRFRDVQSVEDCIEAREAWLAEGRPANTRLNAEPEWFSGRVAPAPVQSPYVDEQIIEAIRAKNGQSKFEVTKLLDLIDELNDNYARGNTYASHALLRAILDHIPPILGCADFAAIANNYSWGRTDKRYIMRLAAFRDQADDALHRQISIKANLLGFDDLPASVCVDTLLQECAEHL